MLYITLSQWELWVPTLGCHHAFFINTYFFSIWYFPDFIIIFFFHQFSCPVVSAPLWPQGLQHARLPCPSPAPRACSNSCPLSQWCHQWSHSLVVSFSSYLQSVPASGSFPMCQFFASGSQSIGVSALASVFPMYIQDWFPLGWMRLISLLSKGLSQESPPTPQFKSINSSALRLLYDPTLTSIHDYWINHSFDYIGKA